MKSRTESTRKTLEAQMNFGFTLSTNLQILLSWEGISPHSDDYNLLLDHMNDIPYCLSCNVHGLKMHNSTKSSTSANSG